LTPLEKNIHETGENTGGTFEGVDEDGDTGTDTGGTDTGGTDTGGDDTTEDDTVISFIETQGTYTHYSGYSVIDVSGALIDQSGNPLSGITVTGTTTVSGSQTQQSTTSGSSGAFSLSFDIYEYGIYSIILETDTGTLTSLVVNVEQ